MWLRRCIRTLGIVAAILLVTGVYLTFRYRPATRVDTPGPDHRPTLLTVFEALHTVGAYVFLALVIAVVGCALVVTSQRRVGSGTILASGFGLFVVSIGFLVTGLQLPWQGFVWVASNASRSFHGIIGFPGEVHAVLVGNDDMTPSRYETIAWIHIAGLPVFAVFAAWWMLGTLHASRRAAPASGAGDARPPEAPDRAPRIEPSVGSGGATRPVGLAEKIFGTDDPETVRLQVDAFLARHLHAGIAALDFTRTGTNVVLGVTLTDGRPAVMHLYPPGVDAGVLRAQQDVQRHLAAQGFPAPQPLLEPVPFGVGLATVEGRLHEPPPPDPGDPHTRRALAVGLAVFVRLAAPLAHHASLSGRGPLAAPPDGVFAPPPGLDFADTAAGAEWIDDLGARARALIDAAPPTTPVVGHFGWRLDTVAVADGRVLGVFDWMDVGSGPESVVIGSAAHQFTIDDRSPRAHVPRADEIREFVADYEAARGTPLSVAERLAARASYVFCTAQGARCEHALAVTGQPAPGRFRERLAATGAALLG